MLGVQAAAPVAYNQGVRRHARSLFSVPITVDHVFGTQLRSTRGISLDMSEGGLGALVESSLEVGQTVAVHLFLADHELRTAAIVRHSSKQLSGLEFVGLTSDQWLQLAVANAPQLPNSSPYTMPR